MTNLSYPRLSVSVTTELLIKCYNAPGDELAALGDSYMGRASFSATGSRRADGVHLAELREAVLELAKDEGFPTGRPGPRFDSALPRLLGERLQMSPAEGGRIEVWNFLTLAVLPDVALWRWPSETKDPTYERLLGKPRNVFRRHWWRWQILGSELPQKLVEDEMQQIVERPTSLGGNPRVAQALANQHLEFLATRRVVVAGRSRNLVREQLMRESAKRVLRIGRVVALSTLSDEQLSDLMREMVDRAAVAQAEGAGGRVELT